MAKKTAPLLPLSDETREVLLELIRQSEQPQTAKQLAKQLAGPFKATDKQLIPVLDEFVEAGILHPVPPATAKGQPRYWDRDINALGRAAVLEALQRAAGPLTAKELAGQLVVPKLAEAAMTAILNEHIEAGRLHSIPPATSKGKPRFWSRDVLEFGRLAVMKALAANSPQSEANLKKAAKGLNETQFQHLFQELIKSRAIVPHPPLGKPVKALFGNRPPAPEPYLKDVATQLTKVVGQLQAAGVDRDVLASAIVTMLSESGLPLPTAADARRADSPSPPALLDLLMLMRQIEPGAERGALVAARDLRRAADLDKLQFDRAVLDLARQGRLMLHRHDYASGLSTTERDELVTDGAGTYYVGMALRQTTG